VRLLSDLFIKNIKLAFFRRGEHQVDSRSKVTLGT
jgi:hypothetical protein